MIKNAQSQETINDQIVNVYYDLENGITTASVNVGCTMQVIKQGDDEPRTNYYGGYWTPDQIAMQTAIYNWLKEVEPGKVLTLKSL